MEKKTITAEKDEGRILKCILNECFSFSFFFMVAVSECTRVKEQRITG